MTQHICLTDRDDFFARIRILLLSATIGLDDTNEHEHREYAQYLSWRPSIAGDPRQAQRDGKYSWR